MKESHHRFESAHLRNTRSLWIHEPEGPISAVTVFLDGEFYRERVGAVEVVEAITRQPDLPGTLFVFVSMESIASRWIECACHPPFVRFIDEELFPWLLGAYPALRDARERVVVGLSYTGLAAAYVALAAPDRFTRVVAQSGSFWWNDCWLSAHLDRLQAPPKARFYLDVGKRETAENVRHKEDVLQVVSQIEGVNRFRQALSRRGRAPEYVEFDGGHDFAAWRRTLPGALRWALGADASASATTG